jgi:2'-hydroxyisoflavone reductase
VYDLSCYHPNHLERLLGVLKGKVGRYVFVSSISAFDLDNVMQQGKVIDESVLTFPCTEEQKQDPNILTAYGEKKAESERILLANDWMDTIIFRPSVIYGKYDPSDRMYYWLRKVKTQNKILVPESGERLMANTYVEDLARAMVAAADVKEHSHIYNAGTHSPVSLKSILDISSGILGRSPKYVNASAEFLVENNVGEWQDMPLWIKGGDMRLDTTKIFSDFSWNKLTLEESLRRSIAYYDTLDWREGKYGMPVAREQELMAKLSGATNT